MRKVLVTGGTKGIGEAIVSHLRQSGYEVTACARKDADVCCDVTDRKQVESLRSQIGDVEILINNVGGIHTAPFLKTTEEEWDWHFSVNLKSIFHCTQVFLPAMLDNQWGRIVNIASTAGKIGGRYISGYVSAKHAVIGLTRSLALEYADKGITVNAVCPSFVDTPMLRDQVKHVAERSRRSVEQVMERFQMMNPQQRFVTALEVAAATRFLIENPGINGQALSICGGETI